MQVTWNREHPFAEEVTEGRTEDEQDKEVLAKTKAQLVCKKGGNSLECGYWVDVKWVDIINILFFKKEWFSFNST